MSPLASGQAITISSGEYTATLVSVGAGIARLQHQGKDLVVPHEPDELPKGYLGKALVPWPNRIVEGTYVYRGETFNVPVNEPETGAALHGLACWADWNVLTQEADRVVFETFIAPQYGYPFALVCRVSYTVAADSGLRVEISAKNVGSTTAPYGSSSHPYLTCNLASNTGYELTVPAAEVLTVDENLSPVEQVSVAVADLDYRTPKVLGNTEIDHAFTQLNKGIWHVDLTDKAQGMTVRLSSDLPWLQIYSGTNIDRLGVAVEPMTCPPDAFNTGRDLIELAPGEETSMNFSIQEV